MVTVIAILVSMIRTTVHLNTYRWGVGNDRKALLVHGLAGSGATWWQIAQGLAASGFEVTAPDLRGHGGSEVRPV
jgi:alpha-beta hydrolase superfamily lysophospholipase